MKCVIPGANVKIFGRSIHSLSKLGEELYVEPLEHGLALRTVNSSRSAYACFLFAPSFFTHYDDGSQLTTPDQVDEDGAIRCKIGMKSCLTVFKSLAMLEKTVDRCKIMLNMDESRLIFQLYCRHGIMKTHNLALIECETLQAVFSKEFCPNVLRAQTRLLSEAVINFQNNQEEISLIVDAVKVSVKNYVDDEPDLKKVIHTEISLFPDEFDNYQVGIDTEVTFCLKELRAILAFSEPSNLPISLYFETPGKPIVFSLDSDPAFEANFVLATLADSRSQASCSQQSQQPATVQRSTATRPSIRPSTVSRRAVRRTSCDSQPNPRTHLANGHGDTTIPPNNTDKRVRPSVAAELESVYNDILNEDMEDTSLCQMKNQKEQTSIADVNISTHIRQESKQDTREFYQASTSKTNVSSPVIPVLHTSIQKPNLFTATTASDSDDQDDVVPGTPPSKKFKSIFFGLSQSTTGGTQEKHSAAVLAADTDDEED